MDFRPVRIFSAPAVSRRLIFFTAALAACDGTSPLNRLSVEGRFEPAAVDFGAVPVGRMDRARVALLNSGEINLTVDEAEISGGFEVSEGIASLVGRTIGSGNRLPLEVTFAPDAEISRQGVLRIVSDETELMLPLAGIGESRLFADLRAEPASVDFGRLAVSDRRSVQVTLTNIGNMDAVIDTVEQTEPEAFRVLTPLPLVVGQGEAASIQIEFAPAVAGEISDTLRLVAGPDDVEVPATGEGFFEAGQVRCRPSPLNFGEVSRGDRSEVAVTCTAVGGPVRLDGSRLTSGVADGFEVTVPLPAASLAINESASFVVRFSAEGLSGDRSGQIRIDYSSLMSDEVQRVDIVGRVVPPPRSLSDIAVSLRWDTSNTDIDLHLVRPGGRFFVPSGDCFFDSPSPDWGIIGETKDNPFLDEDNRIGLGPESISLSEATPGRYQVWAHFFSATVTQRTWVTVDITLAGAPGGTYRRRLDCSRRWLVGVIDWDGQTGTFIPDTLEDTYFGGTCNI
ncbi:MAG: choice-of-anchor D domain-containing protein [Myxococcota bacterium]